MEHSELCNRAEKWLKNTVGCGVVFKELTAYCSTGEIPDSIGFRSTSTYLIECKTSRADFHADKRKIFRRNPHYGMGDFRFYMCPPEVIKPEDLPEKWGLLWVYPKKITKVIGPESVKFPQPEWRFQSRKDCEMAMMYSALRRMEIRGYLKEIYDGLPRETETKNSEG